MIDERVLIKTLLQWKENGNKFAGLKEDALIDKVIAEITNMSMDNVKTEMCQQCTEADRCYAEGKAVYCPLDWI